LGEVFNKFYEENTNQGEKIPNGWICQKGIISIGSWPYSKEVTYLYSIEGGLMGYKFMKGIVGYKFIN